MICTNCTPHFETDAAGPWVELCPRHALNERLAEALREYISLDAACPPRIQKLIQEYDNVFEALEW